MDVVAADPNARSDDRPDGIAVAWVPVRTEHSCMTVPLLFVGGRVEWSVYEFMRTRRNRGLSASALAHRIAAIALLFAYYRARGRPVLTADGAVDLYQDLAEIIILGSAGSGQDLPGFDLRPCGSRGAARHLRGIGEFSDYLVAEHGGPALNPAVPADCSQLAFGFRRHLERMKANSLFSHLVDVRRTIASARVGASDPMRLRRGWGGSRKSAPIGFPEQHVTGFFSVGLRRRKVSDRCGDPIADNYNVRDLLYFMILMFGGLRGAAPLHLYVGDVQPDRELGQGTSVFLWHPADGPSPEPRAPGRGGTTNRRDYLARRFGRLPRNEMRASPQAAGWKNVMLEETVPHVGKRTRVYWQNAAIGQLFWKLHGIYMRHVRPTVTSHPYYFVSLDRGAFGEPWTDAAAQDAFAAALRRMRLEQSSSAGLCRHAMRHRLGRWLVTRGIAPQIIQVFLHHQNLASQAAYSHRAPGDVGRALAAAAANRESGVADFLADDLGLSWKSDPLDLFAGPSEGLLDSLRTGLPRT